MDLKDILNRLFRGDILSREEARDIISAMGKGAIDASQVAAFLTCYNMRPVTGAELAGFRQAMIELAVPVDFSDLETIDVCGTGGDGKDTFNISTTASFVIAGAGYKVAKHGNYGVSSGCGSSNVLEFLGYEMTNDPGKLRSGLERANFCYMHAPLFHPAMKHVAPVRKAIKVKTFFNLLGPLLNPSRPRQQLTGVFSEEIMPLYRAVFEDMDIRYAIIHAADGYDEISLTGPFRVVDNTADSVVRPDQIGLPAIDAEALHGGTSIAGAAGILTGILSGNGSAAQRDVVCANAAYAIRCFNPGAAIADCLAEARESLDSGKAYAALKAAVPGS
jgi:anthranilate phosphoribosyltransferase